MNIIRKTIENINNNKKVILLIVVENKGSSPGRQGFKMLVVDDGKRYGSIGGGATEHKLVNRAYKMLEKNIYVPELHEQIHRTEEAMHASGMICSGENIVILYPIDNKYISDFEVFKRCFDTKNEITLTLGINELKIEEGAKISEQYEFKNNIYKEVLGYKHIVCIVGGGHVGLALSKQMKILEYTVKIYDNRPNLDTLEANDYADEKHIINFEKVDEYIPDGKNIYIVIASFSHTHDKKILTKLLNKKVAYIGMMGSKNKVKEIFSNLIEKGYSKEQLKKISAPIGVVIKSKTPEEIAVSIAAEIIKTKNTI